MRAARRNSYRYKRATGLLATLQRQILFGLAACKYCPLLLMLLLLFLAYSDRLLFCHNGPRAKMNKVLREPYSIVLVVLRIHRPNIQAQVRGPK